MAHFDDIYDIAADGYGIITAPQAREAGAAPGELNRWCTDGRLLRRGHGVYKLARWVPGCPRPTTPTPRPWRSWAAGPTCMASPRSPPSNSGDRKLAVANRKPTAPTGNHARNGGNSWSQNTRRWPSR